MKQICKRGCCASEDDQRGAGGRASPGRSLTALEALLFRLPALRWEPVGPEKLLGHLRAGLPGEASDPSTVKSAPGSRES